MKIGIYTIFDSAASAFMPPFYMQTDGLAIRAFQDNVNSREPNAVSQHPSSFTLFKAGEFDDSTCTFDLSETPRKLALGIELLQADTPRYTNIDMAKVLEAIREIKVRPALSNDLEVVK